MELQGRKLVVGLQGDDVNFLQNELQRTEVLDCPAAEVNASSFEEETYDAVGSFQAKSGLPVTNTLEQATADKIQAGECAPARDDLRHVEEAEVGLTPQLT
jgi:hypothetical protein